MARLRSDNKRDAILAAAISVFAEGGLSAIRYGGLRDKILA